MSVVKRIIKHSVVLTLIRLGVATWARRRLIAEGAVLVLMFHRVLPANMRPNTKSLPGIIVSERTFEDLIEHVKKHADVVPAEGAEPGETGSTRARFVFTFDDGWLDNYDVAFPIARRHGVPFTIFVCPALMDTHQPFWPERVIAQMGLAPHEAPPVIESFKQMPPATRAVRLQELARTSRDIGPAFDRTITWEALHQMRKSGVSFGSHSNGHEILTLLDQEQLADDLGHAYAALSQELGGTCPVLAYPNGNTSPTVASAVASAGHARAFTTVPAAWMKGTDPYHIPRINMCDEKLVGPFGGFSPAAFDYAVYVMPFLGWVREAPPGQVLSRLVGRPQTRV